MTHGIRKPIGRSVEGRDIIGVFYGIPPTEPEQTPLPIDTLLIGVVHGDEGISGLLLDQFITTLTSYPAQIPPRRFIVIPVLNPDGHHAKTRKNARGVDLNRNLPTLNWQATTENPAYHPGPSPASEPETHTVLTILEHYPPNKIISIHSPYRVINYDGPAKSLAHAMSKHNLYPVTSDIGYPTPGSLGTYTGIERNIPTITLELPDTEQLTDIWPDNQHALHAAIQFSETKQ